jgi:hypothetical protein
MQRRSPTAAFAFALAISAVPATALLAWPAGEARAHTDDTLAKRKTPNGGQMKMAGPYHVEFLVRGTDVKVFLFDHGDQPLDVSKAKVSVQLLAGSERVNLDLAAAGKPANEARGQLAKPLKGDVKAVVRVQGADGAAEQVRYSMKLH